MKKIFIPIFIIIAIIIIALVSIKKDKGVEDPVFPIQRDSLLTPTTSFNWEFEETSALNLDGQPQTEVYLRATYENNISDRKLIDTVDGSCSELPGKYEGDISNTGKVQCYFAGLGQQYRITSGENLYIIERKLFEEALPDSPPINYEWEPLAEFPLLK